MLAVARVNYGKARCLRDLIRRACMFVAHDNAVNLIGAQRFHGIHQAFAFYRGRRRAAKRHGIAAQTLFSQLERASGAR